MNGTRKITDLPMYNPNGDITEMAINDPASVIRRVNLSEFDCTSFDEAVSRVKKSLDQHGHVLIIPYKPL